MDIDPSEEASRVIFPFNKDQFAGFINSLLGKPQTIEQKYAFPFEVSKNDIEDTFSLIEQRVHDQNKANLVQFCVNVSYNDGSSIEHNSLNDFLVYKEVQPLIPSSIILSWTYLIHFENRPSPEKQEIELSFISHASYFSPEYSCDKVSDWFVNAVGMSRLQIKHTSRSWGADIQSLMMNHMKTYEKQESSFRKWCRKHSGIICLAFVLIIIAIGMTGYFIVSSNISAEYEIAVEKLISQKYGATIDEKINFIINQSTIDGLSDITISSFFLVVSLAVIGIIGAGALSDISRYKEPSFIVISKTSQKHKRDILQKMNKGWRNYVAIFSGGIATGVIANIIFTVIWFPK